MTVPGIITGGAADALFKVVNANTQPESNLGVFGKNPGATPKYAFNSGKPRDAEYSETLSRLFIELPRNRIADFLKSVSPQTRPLAQVLATGTGTGGAGGTGFIDFLLTQANEGFQEKTQIVDTLTDNYVAFYSGQEPPVFQYGGVLLNTYQDDQRVWMLRLYREILRGTRLANRNLIARLRYDSFIVSGYLENLSLSLVGDTDNTGSQFYFSMRVKRMQVITPQLGGPTRLTTGVLTDAALRNENESLAENERVGAVTNSTPPTATRGPATDVSSATAAVADRVTRDVLREFGKSDDEITAVLQEAAAQGAVTVSEQDIRDQVAEQRSQGQNRIGDTVRGTDPSRTNPENTTNDALGGSTNVYGTEPGAQSLDAVTITPRKTLRTRGRATTASP